MFRFHMTRVSSNAKTGPIPVTTSSENTCPTTCALYNSGCYAKTGPLALHWRKVSDETEKRSLSFTELLNAIKELPKGQLWRMNQAGDLPHVHGYIEETFLNDLIKANKRKKGFTYTHHDIGKPHNLKMIQLANENGFTVSHSADTVKDAVRAYKQFSGVPVVTLLPIDAPNVQTVTGVKVVACPAEKSDKVNCSNCALCADSKREYIIGFRVHGVQKNKANIIAKG